MTWFKLFVVLLSAVGKFQPSYKHVAPFIYITVLGNESHYLETVVNNQVNSTARFVYI